MSFALNTALIGITTIMLTFTILIFAIKLMSFVANAINKTKDEN